MPSKRHLTLALLALLLLSGGLPAHAEEAVEEGMYPGKNPLSLESEKLARDPDALLEKLTEPKVNRSVASPEPAEEAPKKIVVEKRQARRGPPDDAFILTCQKEFLPEPQDAANFEPNLEEIDGILITDVEVAQKLVATKDYFGGGFVPFHDNLRCGMIANPRYAATIWNHKKRAVWCAVYRGKLTGLRECVAYSRY